MKPVLMFITDWCPYCKQAHSIIEDLKNTNPEYANIEVKIIDEERQPEIAKQYDYYYVPTFYVDGVKIHEGVPSKDIIRKVFDEACK
ncbi:MULTISPECIES: thioredoxin family protein [Clostridium]|uniref:Thioredoxin family protein n=1 Tax=Clostridium frigoriphilum TaxID=443253 RepID=A0ABU7USI7_9CLOT|nr:thioredoxin family protein [Clostridium sp. DSM 17811]MBU3101245.1 thioredoxin family protein [Clostridium sp. DSM 17811]